MSLGHRTIGAYRILEPLGHGGMGVVYLAEHLQTGQQVALKTVSLLREWVLQSIRREILALARIRDPGLNVILMTAFGTEDVAVEAMKKGADDYFSKPVKAGSLSVRVDRDGAAELAGQRLQRPLARQRWPLARGSRQER